MPKQHLPILKICSCPCQAGPKIAGLFCKAFEKAVLLTPTEENVRIWAECTRMNQDEIRDSAQEARELAEVFTAIANILGTMLKDQGGNESIA